MIDFDRVSKIYGSGAQAVAALRGITLSLAPGALTCIEGPSGSGKTTLLHLAGGLDVPTEGEVRVAGESIGGWDDARMSAWRRRHVGFVFQFFNLLPTLTAIENAGLPLLLDGRPTGEIRRAAREALERAGVAHRAERLPREMSGGEMQRVAVARAIAGNPRVLLADEPTGNLDSTTGAQILDLLCNLAAQGRTVVVASHDPRVAARATRTVRLRDGAVEA